MKSDKQVGYLESILSNRKWLAGDELYRADYSVAAMSTYFGVTEFSFKSYPGISAWLDRLSENEASQKTEHPIWRQ